MRQRRGRYAGNTVFDVAIKKKRSRTARRRRRGADRVLLFLIPVILGIPPVAWSAQGLDGERAPDFALKSLTGPNLRLSEYRGEIVLVNFWATWCGRCREQLSVIDELYGQYQGRGFQVLSVSVDGDTERARRTVADLRLQIPVLSDDRNVVSRLYDLGSMPLTVLIDPDGAVRHVHEGYERGDEQTYRLEVEELLAERRGAAADQDR